MTYPAREEAKGGDTLQNLSVLTKRSYHFPENLEGNKLVALPFGGVLSVSTAGLKYFYSENDYESPFCHVGVPSGEIERFTEYEFVNSTNPNEFRMILGSKSEKLYLVVFNQVELSRRRNYDFIKMVSLGKVNTGESLTFLG